jgi:hypothetical protein
MIRIIRRAGKGSRLMVRGLVSHGSGLLHSAWVEYSL